MHRLLRDGGHTPERSALLAGTLRKQLRHAAARFDEGDDSRGTDAVVGALYLLRIGDTRADMFDRESSKALAGAIAKFSARGDEGRALALMLTQASLFEKGAPEQQQLEIHLNALHRWMRDTRTGGDMVRLGADMRAAVGRALLDSSEESLNAAAGAIDRWIERAVEYNLAFQKTRQLPPREEAHEAFKALRAGGTTMAAVYLRYGLARAALEQLETTSARRVVPMDFFGKLRTVAEDDDAEDWRLLAREFARAQFEVRDEMPTDAALLNAALWGVALEAYRRDPTSQAVAHVLADQLLDLGFPEVAPLVLQDSLSTQPSVVALNAALSTVAQALSDEFETTNGAVARRIFAASRGLLAVADQKEYQGRLKPSAADLRQLMASIELRVGNAEAARPLFLAAVRAEPTVWGLTMLAMLERQMGKKRAALEHASIAAELPEARALPLDVAEAKLLSFEILRDEGANDRAQGALEQALMLAHTTRSSGTVARQIRAERLLARALDGYGARDEASKALDRALDIAGKHRPHLGPMMLTTIGRALVYGNLNEARAALQLGIKAGIDQTDLVYGAVWLMLLELELDKKPDGKVERVLVGAINDRSGWTGELARWARGITDDADLRAAAGSHIERVEAEFYISMRERAQGRAGAERAVRAIAAQPLLELMEVQLAREILAPRIRGTLPQSYRAP